MKHSNRLFFYLAISIMSGVIISCNQKKTETTSDGQEYTYIREGTEAPKDGDFIIYHLAVQNAKDSTFISTKDQGMPGYLQYYDTLTRVGFMDEIFLNLKKGDSIALEAPAEKIFESNIPPFLNASENIKIRIGVIDILDEEKTMAYFNNLQMKAQEDEMAKASGQLELEATAIDEYVKDNNLQGTKTESGLYYVIEKAGDGPAIEEGDQASVHYAGYLLNGKIFDTSRKEVAEAHNIYNPQRDQAGGYAPFDLQVGVGQVIPGWDEGLSLLKKGDKAKFIIPSPLAYGSRGAGADIPANSILIFDVEIMDVNKN
jgi:FKBP-type peptidyl-prolyl cis-trans isomerase FkpA